MSRRARIRHDKRATAIELAHMCGHGTPMPNEEAEDIERDFGVDPPVPDRRIPIAPFDVKPRNSESHA